MAQLRLPLVAVSFLLFGLPVHAFDLPHFKQVLDTQIKCDSEAFKSFPWSKPNRRLDTKTVAVISSPLIVEVPSRAKGPHGRSFEVSFTSYALLDCSNERPWVKLDEVKGEQHKEIWTMSSYEKPGSTPKMSLGGDRTQDSSVFYNSENGQMVCLVELDALVASPSAINLDKLCAGEPAKNREATKKAIAHDMELWKAAGVHGGK